MDVVRVVSQAVSAAIDINACSGADQIERFALNLGALSHPSGFSQLVVTLHLREFADDGEKQRDGLAPADHRPLMR